jgi:nucleotidyltransferase/DNA polymerase involved in DNA repair
MREPGLAPPDAATRVAEAARAAEPLLDMKQRTTRDDPDGFMDTFFRASRLHYIGTWKHRYEAFLEDLPAPPPLPTTKRGDARVVMHVDMDCFFAAVATLGRPELRGLPVAVSWSSGAKGAGELSSCNYEARAFGCRAGGRVADALRRCPNLVVMPYEFEKYSAVALEVYRILHDVTPHVMGVSVDEAYIDVTALVTGGGRSSRDETSRDSPTGTPNETKRTPKELAEFVRERVFNETGCVASVGIGPNRLIARLATMRAKPNGVFEVSLNEAEAYVASLPVRNLPGVGRGALEKLSAVVSPAGDVKNEKNEKDGKEANACIACRDVLRVPSERLQRALGRKSALGLLNACRGIDQRDWVSRPPRKSVGAQVTWGVRFDEASEVVAFAAKLAGEVSARAVRLKVKGRCLTVKVLRAVANVPDGMMKGSVGHGVCDHLTRSVTLSSYADGAETLAREAMNILAALAVPAGEIRGMGLQLSKLDSDPASASRGASDLRRTARLHAKPAGRRTEWAERGEAIERRYAGWFDGGGARLKTKTADSRDSRRDASAKKRTSPRGKANAYAEAMDSAMGDDLSRGLVAALARGSRSRKRAAEEATDAEAEEKKGGLSRDAASSDSSGDEDEPPVSLRRAHAAASRAHAHGVFVETGDIADDALKNTNSVTLESRLKASAASTLRECESFALKRASSVFEKKGPDEAARVVSAARRLARAQWTTPPVAFALCGAGAAGARAAAQQRAFADAWIEACDRVEEEVVRVALTQ